MMINNCAFCREYEKAVNIGEIENEKGGYKLHLRVCLYSKSENRVGGKHYTKVHTPMKLKFCPSCGKKIERVEIR